MIAVKRHEHFPHVFLSKVFNFLKQRQLFLVVLARLRRSTRLSLSIMGIKLQRR